MPSPEKGHNGDDYPQPFPALIRVVHLYGKATDILNNANRCSDSTLANALKALVAMAEDLGGIYQQPSSELAFNIPNFQHYARAHQSSAFLLLNFWFHALIVLLHQPTVLAEGRMPQLFPYSHELSMSSAKTIADIFQLSLDIKAPGDPFISQPTYIAA